MKKIYITLIVLVIAMIGMAYLYFSRLNLETSDHEMSLHAATANSGLVFSIENDKSIWEILKGQDLFEKLIGTDKFNQLRVLKEKLVTNQAVNMLVAHRDIFISFSAAKDKHLNYLISTQLNHEHDQRELLDAFKANGIKISTEAKVSTLKFNDSVTFYIAVKKNMILLSNAAAPVEMALNVASDKSTTEFTSFINSSSKRSKNSVGNLYIDFNRIPELAKALLPGKLNGGLAILANQNAFAALNYNFSKERLFFNGSSKLNNQQSYLALFSNLKSQKNTIDNLLPAQTANFRLYSITGYKTWLTNLKKWFSNHKEDAAVKNIIANTTKTYRLNPDEIFPEYFKNQLILFQLNQGENLAAINLSNGDKVKQLMLDISEDYDQDIKKLKVPGLLYCYFGEPLKSFPSPYYTVIDNYMVISNYPSALQQFLRKYRNNELLVNDLDYINQYSQLSNSASVTFYVNRKNSAELSRNTFYLPYYKHSIAGAGLAAFSSFIFQLTGDQGNFQTNLLINTPPETKIETTGPLLNNDESPEADHSVSKKQ
jgi:hypothetical protein